MRRECEREQREDGMEEKAKNRKIQWRKSKRLGRSLRSPPSAPSSGFSLHRDYSHFQIC